MPNQFNPDDAPSGSPVTHNPQEDAFYEKVDPRHKFKIGDKVSVPVRFGETGVVKELKDGRYGVEFQNLPMTLWYDENELLPQVGQGFSWAR